MLRLILGAAAGVVAWLAVVAGVGLALRAAAPEIAAALGAHATTLALAERLAISFLGSLAGGFAAALVARDGVRAPLVTGLLMLLFWGYYHIAMIWNQFPLWYHLIFFVSLPLLSVLGGRLAKAR